MVEMGRGTPPAVIAPPSPAVTLGAFRDTQEWLFTDLQTDTVVTTLTGQYAETPARASVAAPTEGFNWGVYGPTNLYVDLLGKWAWANNGGDWVNTQGVAQATTSPHFTFAANNVTSGGATYTADITKGLQHAETRGRWNAYIVKTVGGLRTAATQRHPSLSPPSIAVTYRDGTTATLSCVACVRLTGSTAYALIGLQTAIMDTLALEFERPTKQVLSATLSITIAAHSATAATVNGYLANPPRNKAPVSKGLSTAYLLDSGITSHPDVLFAQRYQDGTVLSDWLIPTAAPNYFTASNWSPHLWGTGPINTAKLPFAVAGVSTTNKLVYKQNTSANISLVPSTYTGDGFEPLAAGIGALRVVTPAATAPDETVFSSGSLGSDIVAFFDDANCGIVDDVYVRFSVRIASPTKRVSELAMYRKDVATSPAKYISPGGKWGWGVHHLAETGGNGQVGGGNKGWSNRNAFDHVPGDAPIAGTIVGTHAIDMNGQPNMQWGQNGMGGALYPNRWYEIEVRCKLNTFNPAGGSPSDGIMQIWIDGQLVATHTGWTYRDGPMLTPGTNMRPFRTMGAIGLWLNDYIGGLVPSSAGEIRFYGPLVAAKSRIGSMAQVPASYVPPWAPAAGQVVSLALNTRQDIDPENNVTNNSNYPGRAPWISSANAFGWSGITSYSGSLYAADDGDMGAIYQYGDAGHSVGGPCVWARFDVAARTWGVVGRPLQTDSLQTFAAGTSPPPAKFDHTWGDWIGDSAAWPAGYAQPGFNPPAGSHTRKSFAYRPAAKAGNKRGQIITTWQPTGQQAGTGLRGSFVYDIDTGLWSRTANPRPSSSSHDCEYHVGTDSLYCVVWELSHFYSMVDILDCATMTWRRVTIPGTGQPYVRYDSTQFIVGDLFVVCAVSHDHLPTAGQELWATPISTLAAAPANGAGVVLTRLNVQASSWPQAPVPNHTAPGGGPLINSMMVNWVPYSDGCLYAVNRGASPNTLWKMTPPAGGTNAALLNGVWTITTQTLGGSPIAANNFDYSNLNHVPALNALVWLSGTTAGRVDGPTQAIRPL